MQTDFMQDRHEHAAELGLIFDTRPNRYFAGTHHNFWTKPPCKRKFHVFWVWAYVHSGVVLRIAESNPFTCRWDSGLAGIITVRRRRGLTAAVALRRATAWLDRHYNDAE